MTDDVARENFKKYGNPDGPGSYSVAIALPKALLQKENQMQVLFCSFFVLLVIIPGFLYINFADSTHKNEGGVLLENKRIFGALLNENLIYKNMPQVLARSLEFERMAAKSKVEVDLLRKLKEDERIAEMMPKAVSK